jgi:hypothetical protein
MIIRQGFLHQLNRHQEEILSAMSCLENYDCSPDLKLDLLAGIARDHPDAFETNSELALLTVQLIKGNELPGSEITEDADLVPGCASYVLTLIAKRNERFGKPRSLP